MGRAGNAQPVAVIDVLEREKGAYSVLKYGELPGGGPLRRARPMRVPDRRIVAVTRVTKQRSRKPAVVGRGPVSVIKPDAGKCP